MMQNNNKSVNLANKYRPRKVEDIVGQDHVKSIIKSAVLNKKCHSTYLFHGPAGTGKTSSARIFAASYNAASFNDEGEYKKILDQKTVDLIEIDAASNRSIDDIRNLRNEIKYLPSEFSKRFIIIDEVHGLTGQAAEASLKMLEEPPSHNVFILCTTEKEKIKDTILSRCIEVPFITPHTDQILSHVKSVISKEGYEISNKSIFKIIKYSKNCMRTIFQNIEKLMACIDGRVISDDSVDQIFCIIEEDKIIELFECIINKQSHDGLFILENLIRIANSYQVVIDSLLEFIKNVLIIKTQKNPNVFIHGGINNRMKSICTNISIITFFEIISIIKEGQEHIKVGAPVDSVFNYMFVKIFMSIQNNAKKEKS